MEMRVVALLVVVLVDEVAQEDVVEVGLLVVRVLMLDVAVLVKSRAVGKMRVMDNPQAERGMCENQHSVFIN